VTAYIQGTELIRFRKVTLSGFCVHCTLYSGIHLADFMFLLYVHSTEYSDRLFLQSSELGPPPPQPQESVSPPPLVGGGGGAHSPACEGVTLRS
jgi:hypothetical protein